MIFYLAALKMITATDSKAEIKKIGCWLIILKQTLAQPLFKGHFYSGRGCPLNYRGSTAVLFQYASTTNECLFVL